MVASFDDDARSAKLSLRQSEILAKLQAIVDGISSSCPDQYVLPGAISAAKFHQSAAFLYRYSIQSMVGSCWSQPLALPTQTK
jgi:glutamate--cysteine ligase catalytic subunit